MNFLLRMEIIVIAIAILLLLILSTRKHNVMMLDEKIFRWLLYAIFVSAILDASCWGIDGQTYDGAREFNILINAG